MHPIEQEWLRKQLQNPLHIVGLFNHVKPVPSKMTGPEYIRLCRFAALYFSDEEVNAFYDFLVEEGFIRQVADTPKTYEFTQKVLDVVAAQSKPAQ